ncbi:hypothetical protein [Cerasicoccus fimbriatus]|uniref:hypothetical protein n=1 Tax=Cerasicoccus fimbriatus TaxID=3014554 RepID=UPI0022B49C52|nr:hypothetical protein [Cerasicoccus sp. TK19100]
MRPFFKSLSCCFRIVCCAAIMASVHTVAAQKEAPRQIAFSTIAFESMPSDLWYEDNGQPMKLQPGGSVRGPRQTYNGPNPLTFFRLEPDGKGGQKRVPQAQVDIPNDVNEALLCFSPMPVANGQLPWQVYAMDDSLHSLNVGEIRFVNLTDKSIAGVLDNETIRLAPGGYETIKPNAKEQNFGIKLAAYLEKQWEPFFSSRWQYRENVRLIVLFLPDAKNGKVRMQAVTQRVASDS